MAHDASENPLPEAIGYALKQVDALLRGRMDEVLRPLGLTVPQYACLELLGQRPGLSNAELARGAFVSRQSMNVVLRGLEAKGLVERPDSVDQGRARPSRLTGEGESVLRRAGREVATIEQAMTAGLDREQREALLRMLRQCAGNLARRAGEGE